MTIYILKTLDKGNEQGDVCMALVNLVNFNVAINSFNDRWKCFCFSEYIVKFIQKKNLSLIFDLGDCLDKEHDLLRLLFHSFGLYSDY